MTTVRIFLASLGLFIFLDGIWLGFVMRKFNLEQLSEIGRIQDGKFKLWLAPALGVYILMSLLMSIYAWPILSDGPWLRTLAVGGLMGLCVYGIFDLTNAAILKKYPLPFAAVDMAWGTLSFAIVGLALYFGQKWLGI